MTGFEMIAATINEPALTSDELRIIATDTAGLSKSDRDILRRSADELDLSNRSLAYVYGALMLAQQELAAVRDRLPKSAPAVLFASSTLKIGPMPLRVSTGWNCKT